MALRKQTLDDGRDDTSLVIYRSNTLGQPPIPCDEKRELAARAGVRFIKCEHVEPCTRESDRQVMGFQPVFMRSARNRKNIVSFSAAWLVDTDGLPRADGAMNFIGDDFTGQGIGYLPDSPYNRVRLATAYHAKNSVIKVVDPQIEAEIMKLGNEIAASVEHRKAVAKLDRLKTENRVQKENRAALGDVVEPTPDEIEARVIENKIKELEAKKRKVSLTAKLEELKRELGIDDPAETADDSGSDEPVAESPADNLEDDSDASEPVGDDAAEESAQHEAQPRYDQKLSHPRLLTRLEVGKLRNKAKSFIYKDRSDLVDNAKAFQKKTKGTEKGWGANAYYAQYIKPLVDQRTKELVDNVSSNYCQ